MSFLASIPHFLSLGHQRHLFAIIALGACACAAPTADVTAPPVAVVPSPVEAVEVAICDSHATWVAFQNDAGPWTKASGAQRAFRVRIATRGGIALMYASDPKYREIIVHYGTAAELASQLSNCPVATPTFAKSMTGAVAGVAAGTHAVVSLGEANGLFTSSTDYSLPLVEDGPRDLVALTTRDYSTWPTRVIVRRALNLASGARIPLLDFDGPEAAALSAAPLTITGIGSGRALLSSTFSTETARLIDLIYAMEAAPTQTIYGVPAALTQPGDHHSISVEITSQTDERMAFTGFRDLVPRTVALGPALAVFTTNTVTTTPYLRPRTRLPSQAEYADGAGATWEQVPATGGWIRITVALSRDYLGGRPDTWEATMPDLTTAGFDPAWGFQPGLPIAAVVGAIGGASFAQFMPANRGPEYAVRVASHFSPSASSSMSILGWRVR